MEEKERYSYWQGTSSIVDNETNKVYDYVDDLLNQQSKRIKELENMNSRLSQGIYWGNGEHFCDVVKKLKQENQQLKQSQNQKAIEKLEKVKESVLEIDKIEINVLENGYSTLYCDRPEVITIIDNQIKKLKEEK